MLANSFGQHVYLPWLVVLYMYAIPHPPFPIHHIPLCTKQSICPVCISPSLPKISHNSPTPSYSRSQPQLHTQSSSIPLFPASPNNQYPPPKKQKKRIVLTSPALSLTLLWHIPLRPLRLRLLYQLALMIVFGIYLMNLGFRREHRLPVYAVENSGAESGPAEDLD